MMPEEGISPPSRKAMLGELRVFTTLPRTMSALARFRRKTVPTVDVSPVMVLPGFSAGDRSTWPLRRFLALNGVAVEGWGLGINRAGLDRPHQLSDISEGWGRPVKEPYHREAGMPLMADLAGARVRGRVQSLGRPMTLVGWSLGGTIAREVARDLPNDVDQVITLGSPIIGGPKYTAAAGLMRAQGLDLDWIEEQIRRREQLPIRQPVTSIYSRSDAIVSWQATLDHYNPRVRAIEVDEAHISLGLSPRVWQLVLDTIRTPVTATT